MVGVKKIYTPSPLVTILTSDAKWKSEERQLVTGQSMHSTDEHLLFILELFLIVLVQP